MRLIYSPDDDGWYWQAYDWSVSQVFPTKEAAEECRRWGRLEWSM